jgi:hypothetical protein
VQHLSATGSGPSALVVFLIAWFVKEVPLRGRAEASEQPAAKLVS